MYGGATCQRVNLDKSSITFGSKVKVLDQERIKRITEIKIEGGFSSYLGLLECFRGLNVQMLDFIHDRLKSRLSSWFPRSLSLGGKKVLLKVVVMALSIFVMSCFKLPKTTCEKLIAAMSIFWWKGRSIG